jgi:hypothetical protein
MSGVSIHQHQVGPHPAEALELAARQLDRMLGLETGAIRWDKAPGKQPCKDHPWNGFRCLILTRPNPNPNCPRHLTWDLGYGFQIAELYKSGYLVIGLAIATAVVLAPPRRKGAPYPAYPRSLLALPKPVEVIQVNNNSVLSNQT